MSGTPLHVRRLAARIEPSINSADIVDLNKLAGRLGAVDILYRTRALDGYTQWSTRGPVIQVAMARSDGRRRATLAHECAHLIVDPVVGSQAFSDFPSALAAAHQQRVIDCLGQEGNAIHGLVRQLGIERVCDLLAFELLLPSARMPELVSCVAGLDALRAAVKRHRVSMSLLVHRINEYHGDITLLRFQRNRAGTWLVPSMAGAPRSFSGRFTCSDTEAGSIDDLERGSVQTTISLSGPRGVIQLPAEFSKLNASCALAICTRTDLEEANSMER